MTWWRGRMAALDLETTAPDPEEARIVTAAFALVGGGEPPVTRTWLADPGVEIPEEATAIHRITTEQAQTKGWSVDKVVMELLQEMGETIVAGHLPLVVFNARYDLTVLDRELTRHHGERLDWSGLRVVDPFVLDKHLDRYRRGSRKLGATCEHYAQKWEAVAGKPVPPLLSEAHDADADALAAARLAWIIGALPPQAALVRRVRNAQEGREKAALTREWTEVREDLDRLHSFQRTVALAERERFAAYKAENGEPEEAARIAAEKGWPVLEMPVTA